MCSRSPEVLSGSAGSELMQCAGEGLSGWTGPRGSLGKFVSGCAAPAAPRIKGKKRV